MGKICPKCGKESPDTVKFCESCGSAFIAPDSKKSTGSFREQLYYSPIELKISIFCCIAAIMSFFYYSIEPVVGFTVLSIVSPTALICLITYFYKVIFGSLNFFSLVIIGCIYVILIAIPFNLSWVAYFALLGIFLSGLIKAFTFIFIKKKTKETDADSNVQAETVKKSSALTVFMAIILFVIDCCLYSPLATNNGDLQAVLKGANAKDIVTEDVSNVSNDDIEKNIVVENSVDKTKAQDVENAKKAVINIQSIVDKKGYADINVLAASPEDENGILAVATVNGKKSFLIYDKGSKSLARIDYSDEILNFLNAKYSENQYKPVKFNLLLIEDKNDDSNKDRKLGKWESNVHNIPIQVLYSVQNEIVVPGQIMSANSDVKPSKYDVALMEKKNVTLVNAVLTNMNALKKNMDILG